MLIKFTVNIIFLLLISLSLTSGGFSKNLSCYQCIRHGDIECEPHELQPCPPVSDRCVTHISKNAKTGFTIKRECGLGPCGFDDDMVNKGLGLNNCDRSRDEYFCISCCRESGCNRNNAPIQSASNLLLLIPLLCICKNKLIG